MTARHTVTLVCDAPGGCDATWVSESGRTALQARQAAAGDGWTSRKRMRDGCPAHPVTEQVGLPPSLGGVLLRVYDIRGCLLYITITQGPPAARLRALRYQHPDWWVLVDPTRTIYEQVPDDTDLNTERDRVGRVEHPRFFRDEYGNQPYLHHTRIIEPQLRGTPLSRLQSKRSS